ncbi:MAG: hypothetical protein LBR80_08325 [Deltaproteobacteria bacterium]|jgi:hypothetical protein|nr:hypothetical protein [Deltaproteobacteria bacterium]
MTPFDTFLDLAEAAARTLSERVRLMIGYERDLWITFKRGALAVGMTDSGSLGPWMGTPFALEIESATGIPVRAFTPGESLKVPPGSAVRIGTGMAVTSVPEGRCWMFVPREMPLIKAVLDADAEDLRRGLFRVSGFPGPVRWHGGLMQLLEMGGGDGRVGLGLANFSPDRDFWLPCGELLGWLVCAPDEKEWRVCAWGTFRNLTRLMPETYDFGRLKEAEG